MVRGYGILGLGVGMLCLICAGCAGAPPINEMAAAQRAVSTARDSHAQVHAEEEYRNAEANLVRARQLLSYEEFEMARRLANVVVLEANYAAKLARWKIKGEKLRKEQGKLDALEREAEQLKAELTRIKEKLR